MIADKGVAEPDDFDLAFNDMDDDDDAAELDRDSQLRLSLDRDALDRFRRYGRQSRDCNGRRVYGAIRYNRARRCWESVRFRGGGNLSFRMRPRRYFRWG